MFGKAKKSKSSKEQLSQSLEEPIKLPISNPPAQVPVGAAYVNNSTGDLMVTGTSGSTYTITSGTTSNAASLTWNGSGLTWVGGNPTDPNQQWNWQNQQPQIYGPGNSGTYWTTYNEHMQPTNLNVFDKVTMTFSGKPYFGDRVVASSTLGKMFTYSLVGKNYHCFIEQDFTDLALQVNQISVLHEKKKRYGILAFDVDLNRFELSSILPEDEPKANLEAILDDNLNFKPDKSEYIASLYGRLVPFVNCKIISSSYSTNPKLSADGNKLLGDLTIEFEHSDTAGIVPFLHLSNLIFGNLLSPTKTEVLESLQKLDLEAICASKKEFPAVQVMHSPEYSYLTLKHPSVVKQHLRSSTIPYTKEGLENFLSLICVEGSNPKPFVQELLNCMCLDQRILNVEDKAVVVIKNLIEQNLD